MEKEVINQSTLGAVLLYACRCLEDISTTPRLDAELLMAQILGASRLAVVTNPNRELAVDEILSFLALVERRKTGEPIAYLRGVQEFWGLEFEVSPSVLIPRPETELLVEEALKAISIHNGKIHLADCGTGSGCIAVALAYELQKRGVSFSFTAIDKSAGALEVARRNAAKHGVLDLIRFVRSEWFSSVPGSERYDVIISNPPYIPYNDPNVSRETFFEPSTALYADKSGLSDIGILLDSLGVRLRPGGTFLCEFGYGQRDLLIKMTSRFKNVRFLDDLAGIPRVLQVQLE